MVSQVQTLNATKTQQMTKKETQTLRYENDHGKAGREEMPFAHLFLLANVHFAATCMFVCFFLL